MKLITTGELRSLMDRGAPTILDVRTAAEYEAARIPGSVRVGLDELCSDPAAVAAALAPHAVVVCQSGVRAERACRRLATTGCDDLRLLNGGISAWERDGGILERGRERWDLERQIRLVAGSLVVAGSLGSLAFPPALLVAGGVGAGLAIAAATNTCAMGSLLARLPYNRQATCDTPGVSERVAQLARHPGEPA